MLSIFRDWIGYGLRAFSELCDKSRVDPVCHGNPSFSLLTFTLGTSEPQVRAADGARLSSHGGPLLWCIAKFPTPSGSSGASPVCISRDEASQCERTCSDLLLERPS
jgi:hypothetical protein